ncbi:MAG: permease-like cell division protein FtsX [Actinomycetota bacterium]
MARLDYYFRETVTGLRRNGLVVFAAISTAFIALLLLGMALLIRQEVDLIIADTTGRVEVVVYLQDDLGQDAQQRLNELLTGLSVVSEVAYESKEDAYERAVALFGQESAIIANVSEDAFPASFRVKLTEPEDYKVVVAAVDGQPGILRVSAQQEVVDRLLAVTSLFRDGVLILAFVMLIASAILIANTVRMGLFARRREIGIMKLVGATNWRIRVPFLIEGVIEGLVGAALAIGVLFVAKTIFIDPLYDSIQFVKWIQTSDVLATIPLMLIAGVVVSLAASVLAMRRFLDV